MLLLNASNGTWEEMSDWDQGACGVRFSIGHKGSKFLAASS